MKRTGDTLTVLQSMRLPCPRCGAAPGERCRTSLKRIPTDTVRGGNRCVHIVRRQQLLRDVTPSWRERVATFLSIIARE